MTAAEAALNRLETNAAVPLDEKPAATSDGDVAPPTVGENFRLYALAAITVIVFGLCAYISLPFLPAITWSVALAIVAVPVHRRIERAIQRPNVAAFISTAVVSVTIIGTGAFVAYHLGKEGMRIADSNAEAPTDVKGTLEKVPGASPIASRLERAGVDIEKQARDIVATFTQDFSGLIQGSMTSIGQFLAAVFLLFFLFRDRAKFLEGLREALPLTRSEADHVFSRASDSVYANLFATFATSVIGGVGIGLMFWWLGLPSPVLWSVVMFILSLLPVVGAGMVWVPAAAYLAYQGQVGSSLFLVAWCLMFFIVNDNILYARLAGPRMEMHGALTLLAFFGGLAVWGISGMVLGPAVLALSLAFLEVWKRRLTGVDPSPSIVTEGSIKPAA